MENNYFMMGEMGDHLPIKRLREDKSSSESQSTSESPIVAKPLPKDTNWVDLLVKEITNSTDLDDAINRAAKVLKSFEASLRDRSIPSVTRYLLERAKVAGNFEGSLDQGSLDILRKHEDDDIDFVVTPDGKIRGMVLGMGDSDTDEEDDLKSGFDSDTDEEDDLNDENGRMPEHINQPMDMVDGNGDKK